MWIHHNLFNNIYRCNTCNREWCTGIPNTLKLVIDGILNSRTILCMYARMGNDTSNTLSIVMRSGGYNSGEDYPYNKQEKIATMHISPGSNKYGNKYIYAILIQGKGDDK